MGISPAKEFTGSTSTYGLGIRRYWAQPKRLFQEPTSHSHGRSGSKKNDGTFGE